MSKRFMFVLLVALFCFVFVYCQNGGDFKDYDQATDILHVLTDMERSVSEALKSIHSNDTKLQKNETETLIAQYTDFLKYVTVENETVLMKPLLGKNFTNNSRDNSIYHNLTESDDDLEKYIEMLEKKNLKIHD